MSAARVCHGQGKPSGGEHDHQDKTERGYPLLRVENVPAPTLNRAPQIGG